MAIEKAVEIRVNTQPAASSVKELRNELKRIKDEMAGLEEGSSAFLEAANRAGTLKHQIDEINESVAGASADFGDMVSNVSKVTAGITGAFGIATSTMQLFGVESEEVNKALETLNNTLFKIPIYLLAIDAGVKGFDKLKKSLETTPEYLEKIDKLINDAGGKIETYSDLFKRLGISDEVYKKFEKDTEELRKQFGTIGYEFRKLQKELNKAYKDGDEELAFKIKESMKKNREVHRDTYKSIEDITRSTVIKNIDEVTKLELYLKASLKRIWSNIKAVFGLIMKHPVIAAGAVVLGLLVKTIKELSKTIQDNYTEVGKLTKEYNQLNKVVTLLNKSLELTKKVDKDIADGWKKSNAIQNQILQLQNLNNEWKAYIANKRAAIENDYENAELEVRITSGLEQAERIIKRLNIAGVGFETPFGDELLFTEPLKDITTKSGNELKKLTQKELQEYSEYLIKETQTNLNKVIPVIEDLQTKIFTTQQDIDSDKLGRKEKKRAELDIKNWQLQLDALNQYYTASVTYQNQNLDLVQAEIKRRTDLNGVLKEDNQNRIKILNQEFENIKSQTKNADIRKTLIDEEIRQLKAQQKLTKEGSAEWYAYDIQISKLINTYKNLITEFDKSFNIQFRHKELWPEIESDIEETDEALEDLLETTYKMGEERYNVWQQLTGDLREYMNAMNEAIASGLGIGKFNEIMDLAITMNNEFVSLQDTLTRFAESSFGIGSEWNNVVADMQASFNNFALAVTQDGEQAALSYTNAVANMAQAAGTMLNAIAEEQDTQTKDGFENSKKLQISATIVNMLGGIMAAWTSAMSPANAWMTTVGQVAVGTAMSAMIAGIGAAQIAKIAKTKFGDSSGASTSSSAINSTIIPPVDYSRLVQGAQTEGAIRDTRQYVSVVEIDNVQKRVNVSESEAKY